MRSLVLVALAGTGILSTNLAGQSLAEHAAAAAGATIGTAAGKPIGTSLGKIFGGMDNAASKAATPAPKAVKPEPAKPAPAGPPANAAAPAPAATVSGGEGDSVSAGRSAPHSAGLFGATPVARHRSARRHQTEAAPIEAAPITPITPVPAEPVVKEPTPQQVASVKVGATANEVSQLLGTPESKVSIPGDDGHLLEICQYWANGEPIGTVRLDNGRVVSVQAAN